MSFQQLFSELEGDLQLFYDGKVARSKDAAVEGITHTPEMAETQAPKVMSAKVLYQGQGVYAYPSRSIGQHRPAYPGKAPVYPPGAFVGNMGMSRDSGGARGSPVPTAEGKFDPLTLAGCFNCDHPGHTMQDCKMPINTKNAARRKLEYLSKKRGGKRPGLAILYQLTQQLDAMIGTDGELSSPSAINLKSDAEDEDGTRFFESLMMSETGSSDVGGEEIKADSLVPSLRMHSPSGV